MVSKTEWMKRTRLNRKALGLCVDCGRQPNNGKVFCDICLTKRKEYRTRNSEKINKRTRELHAKRKAQGLCKDCGKPTNKEYILCESCKERHKLYALNYSRKNGNRNYDLEKHREYVRILRTQRIAIGLCPYCGEAMDRLEGLRCNRCREEYRIYKKDYYERTKKSKGVNQ